MSNFGIVSFLFILFPLYFVGFCFGNPILIGNGIGNVPCSQQASGCGCSESSPHLPAAVSDRDMSAVKSTGGAGDQGTSTHGTSESYSESQQSDFDDQLGGEPGYVTEPTSTALEDSVAGSGVRKTEPETILKPERDDSVLAFTSAPDIPARPAEIEINSRHESGKDPDVLPICLPTGSSQSIEEVRKVVEKVENVFDNPATTGCSFPESRQSSSSINSGATPSIISRRYCMTGEAGMSILKIRVGEKEDEICRWELYSVLTYNIDMSSFPDIWMAMYALEQLVAAAEDWNDELEGTVHFKLVPNCSAAVFRLGYNADFDDMTLAEAFLPRRPRGPASDTSSEPETSSGSQGSPAPSPWPQARNQQRQRAKRIYVTPLCFEAPYLTSMRNVFLHELGHVLGIRHSFAGLEANPSHLIGPEDHASVMDYYEDWGDCVITADDVRLIKKFYRLGMTTEGTPIYEIAPHPVLERGA